MTDLLALLQDFYRDKLTQMMRHQAGARFVGHYDHNNTYQYIIAREEVQLSWIAAAIRDLGGTPVDNVEAERAPTGKGDAPARTVMEEDARDADAFASRWRPRVERVTNARHRRMLTVILGETLEHKRFFEQALAGRSDLLGQRSEAVGISVGKVLPSRWIE